jgi:hypothetical protein
MDVGFAGLIASKLAPTGFAVYISFVSAEDPMWERACSRWWWLSHIDVGMCPALALALALALAPALALDLDLDAPLTTLAERRHCAVGIPAWMPG